MSKRQFGLIGKNISYSFSKKYFTEKFALGNLEDYFYENFDLQSIDEFPEILKNNSDLKGLNVTIPFKETIIPYLDKLSKNAQKIGAVNVIRFTKKGSLKGYNSDYYGFIKSLKPLLKEHHKKSINFRNWRCIKRNCFWIREIRNTLHFCFSRRKRRHD